MPFAGILPADDGFGQVIALLVLAEGEPLVLDNPGVGGLGIGVVHGSVALEVGDVQQLRLEADGAVFQCAQTVAKVGIDGAGVDYLFRQRVQLVLMFQIIDTQTDFDAIQQILHQTGVAAHGNALIKGVEVVVVEGQADGQTLDDEAGQFVAGTAPLLLGVALDELFINIGAHQRDGLFFQILWLGDARGGPLLRDFGRGLVRGHHAPHFIEGVHIEGQAVQLPLVVGHGGVGEAVEGHETVDIIPDFFVIGMENVGAVFVHVNALHLLGVDIAGDVIPLVNDQDGFSRGFGLLGEDGAVKTGTDD